MANTQAICNVYKTALFNGVHETGDTYKIALYTSSATLDKSTTAYSATNEISGTGYTATGATLTGRTVALATDLAYLTWDDPAWTTATFTANAALIYNDTEAGDAAICVLTFGGDVTVSGGTFTIDFPAVGATALLRIP